jgi:hypothetical protein
MAKLRASLVVAIVAASSAVVFARADISITPIPSEGRILVSFTARDSWTMNTRDFLQIGTMVIYDYVVELRRPGFLPLGLVDSTLARTPVASTAQYNTLTRKYTVQRLRNGRIFRSETAAAESDVREWLTTFDQVELEPTSALEPNIEYYVQIVLSVRPRRSVPSLYALLPFGREENSGRKFFTYLK